MNADTVDGVQTLLALLTALAGLLFFLSRMNPNSAESAAVNAVLLVLFGTAVAVLDVLVFSYRHSVGWFE